MLGLGGVGASTVNAKTPPTAIDPRVLDEAADWLTLLAASDATDKDRTACARWQQSSPEHARAWARAEALLGKLSGLPAGLAMPALNRPANARRRAALASVGKLAALLATLPTGWVAWTLAEGSGWTADHHTAAGERRNLQLSDGSRLTLDTATAIDERFDSAQRLVRLRAGQILVETATKMAHHPMSASNPAASVGLHRPFRVATSHGRMEALGTRFTVREMEGSAPGVAGRTHVAVLEGAVRIEPRDGASMVLHAGEQAGFTAEGVGPVASVDPAATAWTRGMLLADNMALAELAMELARYRRGTIHCDPGVAGLRVSGAFPVGDADATDRALTMLVSTYPVQAQLRLLGLWVTLVPG